MGRRKQIVHISWKPIEPKRRFRKRRTVRWIESMKRRARRMLDNVHTPRNRRARARIYLDDITADRTFAARLRASQYFGWYLMGAASGDERLDAYFDE